MDTRLVELKHAGCSDFITSFFDNLNVDKSISSRVVNSSRLFVIAPSSVSEGRLYQFNQAGIYGVDEVDGGGRQVFPVRNDPSLMVNQVGSLGVKTLFIHDPIKRIEEASSLDGLPFLIDRELFYRVNPEEVTEANLGEIVLRNTLSWHFFMIGFKKRVDGFNSIADAIVSSDFIVIGIYDGESYLILNR